MGAKWWWTYNCTFMELKWRGVLIPLSINPTYNCTFMELKYYSPSIRYIQVALIIAPLWNWNWQLPFLIIQSTVLIIAPLWNWNLISCTCSRYWLYTYNCTFMELKSMHGGLGHLGRLLIIAPLWNWNCWVSSYSQVPPSYNCTFMELKLHRDCVVRLISFL